MQQSSTSAKLPFAPLLLIAPFFLWGTAMVAMKGVVPHTTPLLIASVRLLPAGLLILASTALMERYRSGSAARSQPKTWRAWLWIALFGLVDGTLFQGFLAEGLVRTGAGLGSVMIDSQPLAVALMARWLYGERVGLWGWLGLAFGVVGISLLGLPEGWIVNLLHGNFSAAIDSNLLTALFQNGQWLMLLAALSMAIGTVMVRVVSRHADPVVATGWHMIIGGLPLLAFSSWFETDQIVNLRLTDWMALSYSTIFGSAIAYGLFFYFASSGSLTSLSSLTFLTPIFALLFGNLFLAEVLSPLQWLGVSLTLVSIYLINQRDQLADRVRRWRQRPELTSETSETSEPLQSSQAPESDFAIAISGEVAETEAETLS